MCDCVVLVCGAAIVFFFFFLYENPSDPLENWKFPSTRYVYWPQATADRFYTVGNHRLYENCKTLDFCFYVLFANYRPGDLSRRSVETDNILKKYASGELSKQSVRIWNFFMRSTIIAIRPPFVGTQKKKKCMEKL